MADIKDLLTECLISQVESQKELIESQRRIIDYICSLPRKRSNINGPLDVLDAKLPPAIDDSLIPPPQNDMT